MSACSDFVVFAIGVPISNDELTSLRSSDLGSGGIVLDGLFARAQRSGIHCRFTTKLWKMSVVFVFCRLFLMLWYPVVFAEWKVNRESVGDDFAENDGNGQPVGACRLIEAGVPVGCGFTL